MCRSSIIWQILLYIDGAALARLAYVVLIKNHQRFADEYWCQFFNIWIFGLSSICMISWHLLVRYQPIGYYLCTGQDPTIPLKKATKVYGVMQISSIVINAISYLIIFIHKRKLNQIPLNKFVYFKLNSIKQFDTRTISTIVFNIMLLTLLSLSTVIVEKLTGVKPGMNFIKKFLRHF